MGEWTRSGDKYVEDEDGYYICCGRADDMLKVSGLYVSPFEVEAALMSHVDVLEAAVVGWNDEQKLIKPKAFVVLKDQGKAGDALVKALQEHVKAKLAPFKYPRWIEFRKDLPKTATGKIQRFMLRVSGLYVSPFEVEAALCSHPDVLEAAVVGWNDEQKLIKPKAFVVLKAADKGNDALAQSLKEHVKSKLAPFKYPRWIEFRKELPKTATGKIQRFKLRAEEKAQ